MSESITVTIRHGNTFQIDLDDWRRLRHHTWTTNTAGYIRRYNGNRLQKGHIFLHNDVMGPAPEDHVVDHINGVKSDNRRCNLRFLTRSQNTHNSHVPCGVSRFFGVGWENKVQRWQARIRVNGVLHILGYGDTEEEAARLYDVGALQFHGAVARLNFPNILAHEVLSTVGPV